jgi:phospholipid-binding lipoprotein MlaA
MLNQIFDVASNWGLEKTQEDFGQTLAVWGTPKGAYVVLPVLGSSTLRDVTGKAYHTYAFVNKQNERQYKNHLNA